ncbi:MAG: hypothetical protein GY826_24570 [Fuerstiella sp.]|nr:hypothetical protein [Fuerstiella sp.]
MGVRKVTKKKPGPKPSVTPERRRLAIVVAILTMGGVVLDMDVLSIFSSSDSNQPDSHEPNEFSELESMLADFGSDAAAPNAQRTEPTVRTQPVALEEPSPLLVPTMDMATEIPVRNVSLPQPPDTEVSGVHPDDTLLPSRFPGTSPYGSGSPLPGHRASVTGIRFTGNIQPIQ